MKEDVLDNFIDSFKIPRSSCYERCNCGKIFYDNYNSWDWEEGEFEAMEADPEATAVSYGVETLNVQNAVYCIDCDCWKELAERVVGFLMDHRYAISEFYRREKKRIEGVAESIPIIDSKVSLAGKRKVILQD